MIFDSVVGRGNKKTPAGWQADESKFETFSIGLLSNGQSDQGKFRKS